MYWELILNAWVFVWHARFMCCGCCCNQRWYTSVSISCWHSLFNNIGYCQRCAAPIRLVRWKGIGSHCYCMGSTHIKICRGWYFLRSAQLMCFQIKFIKIQSHTQNGKYLTFVHFHIRLNIIICSTRVGAITMFHRWCLQLHRWMWMITQINLIVVITVTYLTNLVLLDRLNWYG